MRSRHSMAYLKGLCRLGNIWTAPLFMSPEGGYDELLCYFNRLSDLLFMLAWSLEVHNLIEYVVREAVAFVIKGGGVR